MAAGNRVGLQLCIVLQGAPIGLSLPSNLQYATVTDSVFGALLTQQVGVSPQPGNAVQGTCQTHRYNITLTTMLWCY